MKSITVDVDANRGHCVEPLGLVLTVRDAASNVCEVIAGFPGQANKAREMSIGDALLYETPVGTIDIRVLQQNSARVRFLVTLISPTLGIVAAFSSSDASNARFTSEELGRIAASLEEVKATIEAYPDIEAAQSELICAKLDDIMDASTRLGRKDWINYAAGALTSACVSAAFTSEVRTALLNAIRASFSWAFATAPLLLQ
jgi:hypothetical protein